MKGVEKQEKVLIQKKGMRNKNGKKRNKSKANRHILRIKFVKVR